MLRDRRIDGLLEEWLATREEPEHPPRGYTLTTVVAGLFDDQAVAMFWPEAQAALRTFQPEIPVIASGLWPDAERRPYVVRPLTPSVSLPALVKEAHGTPRLALSARIALARSVLEAIDRAHSASQRQTGTAQRLIDLDPPHIDVDAEGRTHFRIAGLLPRPVHDSGPIRARFEFMSPEAVLGHVSDVRSNFFTFGSLLYFIATGRPPFEGTSQLDTLNAIRHVSYRPASEALPGLPKALDEAIARCLQLDPSARIKSAADLLPALDALARTRPVLDLVPVIRSSSTWAAEHGRLQRAGIDVVAIPRALPTSTTPMVKIVRARRDRRPDDELQTPAFEIDRHLVTCAEYARFLEATDRPAPTSWPGGQLPPEHAHHPVVGLTWGEAQDYADWLGKRLPTEAEWEQAVAQDAISDLAQLWEWVDTWHEPGFIKVVRGGAWRDRPGPAKPSHRSFETRAAEDVGFRCARDR